MDKSKHGIKSNMVDLWLTVVILRSRRTRLASGNVECGAAWGCATQNHGSHSQSGHILGESGAHHSGTWCGLAQRRAWRRTTGDSTLTSSRRLTQGHSDWTELISPLRFVWQQSLLTPPWQWEWCSSICIYILKKKNVFPHTSHEFIKNRLFKHLKMNYLMLPISIME